MARQGGVEEATALMASTRFIDTNITPFRHLYVAFTWQIGQFVIPSEARNLSLDNPPLQLRDPSQVLRFAQDKLRMTTCTIFISWGTGASLHGDSLHYAEASKGHRR